MIWWRVFLPFAAGYFLSYFLRNVNAVISPELVGELGLSAADLGLLTSAYLFAFGAVQLPLGILLDRYGGRRVEAGLLLFAAAGCALFALGHSLPQLALGRALIGLGVSACLMAAFKTFGQWFGLERQASLNALIMASGGLGALTASVPLSLALPLLGWRGIFLALAAAAVLVAGFIFSSPDKSAPHAPEPLRHQLAGLAGILGSRVFWRFAPQATLVAGSFIAMQGLWAVPWLMKFSGYDSAAAAEHLGLMSLAMLTGFLALAVGVGPAARRGIGSETLLKLGTGAGLVALLCIVFGLGPTRLMWFVFGLAFSSGNLAYATLQSHFPPTQAGRANTALNLMIFVGAFSIQWGYGVLIDALQAQGLAERSAYQASFGLVVALQIASYAWFLLGGVRRS